VTVQASPGDPRIADVDPHSASLTVGRDPLRLGVLSASPGVSTYSVQLAGAGSTPSYQGTGTIAVGQEISCTPAHIKLQEAGLVQVLVAPGAFYDPLYNGSKFTVRSLDEHTAKVSTSAIGIGDTPAGGSLTVSAFFAGATTVEVTGTRAWGPAYTACIIDVTVVPASGTGTIPTNLYIQQTDASMQRLTTVLRAASAAASGVVVPVQAAAGGSELVCSAGIAPLYSPLPVTSQALQKTVTGTANAQAMCFWTPGASGAPLTYQFSTFFGGSGNDRVFAAVPDAQGNLVVVGSTDSKDFPTVGSKSRAYSAKTDGFVAKLSRLGDRLLFATYLGGSDDDAATAVAVDGTGNLWVTGNTQSADFPLTNNAAQVVAGGSSDAFLVKLDGSTGALLYSTRFGGAGYDAALAVAVDTQGAPYIAGFTSSLDLPVTAGAYQKTEAGGPPCPQSRGLVPCPDAFVAKFSAAGAKVYATYLGGTNYDYANAVAVDAAGNAVVAGWSSSADFFPPMAGAVQSRFAGGTCTGDTGPYPCTDGFVVVLNPSGTTLNAATFLGGFGTDQVQAMALDGAGNVYLTGITDSPNFRVSPGAFQIQPGGGVDAFVTVLGPGLTTLLGSSYFGGSGTESPGGIALGRTGRIYFVGSSTSKDLPAGQPPAPLP